MKHQIVLNFKSREEAREFVGQLSDGFGEEYVDIHPSEASIKNWDDTSEFDVELVDKNETSLRSGWGYVDEAEGGVELDTLPPVDPHIVTERLTKAIRNVERTRKEIFGDWEEGDDE